MPLLPAPQQVIAIESAKLEKEEVSLKEFTIIPPSLLNGVKEIVRRIRNVLKPREIGEEEEEEEDFDSQSDDVELEEEGDDEDRTEVESRDHDYEDEY